MKKKGLLILVAILVPFALFAKGAKEEATTVAPATAVAEPVVIQGVSDAKAQLAEIPQATSYRDAVTIVINAATKEINPLQKYGYENNQISMMVYDMLLKYVDGKYEGLAAKSWNWEDADFTRLHVVLNDDIYFTNGNKLTSVDVQYSLDNQLYTMITQYYDHTEILNDSEFTIVLKSGCTEFLFFLSECCSAIVNKAACEADPEWGFAIGSGPWKLNLGEFKPGIQIVLERNDAYRGQKPNTKKLTFKVLADNSAALVALQNGEVDWVPVVLDSETAIADADPNVVLLQYAGSTIEYLAFNTVNGGSLVNQNLRKAVAYAIDKETIKIAAGQENAKIADSMWGWTESGYFTDFDEVYSYNPEKAKEYVAKAKAEGVAAEFSIMCNSNTPAQVVIAQMVQEMCGAVGITVTIDETDSSGITANTKWGSAKHQLLTYHISLSASNTSPWDFYMAGQAKNRGFCSDERVQELLKLAAAKEDNAEYYAEIQKINNDFIYYIPLYYRVMNVAYTNGLGGVKIRMAGGMDFTYACIPQ